MRRDYYFARSYARWCSRLMAQCVAALMMFGHFGFEIAMQRKQPFCEGRNGLL